MPAVGIMNTSRLLGQIHDSRKQALLYQPVVRMEGVSNMGLYPTARW